jgi:hypothetical protein
VSAATERARAEFGAAMKDAHNVVFLSAAEQLGRGRRHRAPSLNRAAIVLTAAAWQAFVEDMTTAILSALAVRQGQQGYALYNLIKAATKSAVGRFNTPNARNTLALFDNVGFDPLPMWTFSIGTPPRAHGAQDVSDELDGWLTVRHKIAHGDQLPANNLVTGRTQLGPSIHRKDAERCIVFFEALVRVTADAAARQFP